MRLGEIQPPKGAGKRRKRVGRGPGSGHGKTSCRGHKGQKARSGAKRRVWFEGGQMPLQRRIPKKGFSNVRFETKYQVVNLRGLRGWEGEVTLQHLEEAGLIRRANRPVKILGEGTLDGPITVRAHAFSRTAVQKIEEAGGRAEVL